MKRLIFKTSFFIVPFAILYFITLIFYNDAPSPDLLRLGYIPNVNKDYRKIFFLSKKEEFEKLSNHKKKKYKILTIGDSFSDRGGYGYQNILAEDGFSVLHVDRFISKNPIQALLNLSNGDFFDTFNIKYVVLQNIERHIIDNIKDIKLDDKLLLYEIDSLIQTHKVTESNYKYQFFSRATIEFPLYHFPRFYFSKNYISNKQVYNVELNSKTLFSNNSNKLLFFYTDLVNTNQNNFVENLHKLNNTLNEISRNLIEKNVKLIVLPSPDKYDLYYDFIVDKKNLTKPLFFDNFKTLRKEYIYIDSKKTLSDELKFKKDIYFFDDTHWTPIASEIIANKIKEKIILHQKNKSAQ